jgi:DNA-binding transcriptional LysR family regulator
MALNWDDLRYVLAVARTGSVASAARKLRVAHTTVYRRIHALEQAHRAQLFERRGNAYEPTPAARTLVDLATEMELRVDALEREMTGLDVRMEGVVRITTVAPLAERLGEHLMAFHELYPAVQLVLRVTNDLLCLEKGEADVAIRVTRDPPETLVGRKVAAVRFGVFGAVHALPREPGALDELDWVGLDDSLADTPQGRWEARHLLPERIVLKTNSRPLFVDCVRHGLGVGVLPHAIGVADEALRALGEPIDELTLPLWLLTHGHLRQTSRVRAVLDFFGDAMAQASDQL